MKSSPPSFSTFPLPRKVALNALSSSFSLHTFSSGGGGGGISFAPFSPLSISRTAAEGAIVISTVGFFRPENCLDFFKCQNKRWLMYQETPERQIEKERELRDGAMEREEESLLQSRKREREMWKRVN